MSAEFKGSGTVYDTHPNEHVYAKGNCYARGFHYGKPTADGGFENCVDCGASTQPGGLTFRDVATDLSRRPVHTEVPEVLTHNPDAGFAERMAARQMTKEEQKAARKAQQEPEVVVTQKQSMAIGVAYLAQWKTRENIIKACGELGIHLVDPEGVSGVNVNLHGQLVGAISRAERAEAQVKELRAQVTALTTPPSDPTDNPQEAF